MLASYTTGPRKVIFFFGIFLTEYCLWGKVNEAFKLNLGSDDASAALATYAVILIASLEGQASYFRRPSTPLKGKVAFPGCLPKVR